MGIHRLVSIVGGQAISREHLERLVREGYFPALQDITMKCILNDNANFIIIDRSSTAPSDSQEKSKLKKKERKNKGKKESAVAERGGKGQKQQQ